MNHAFVARRSRTKEAQTSKSAVSRISKSAGCPNFPVLPTWKLDRFKRERLPSYAIKPELEFGCARRCGTRECNRRKIRG